MDGLRVHQGRTGDHLAVAQVYQFVDDNGVTRLFAEIVPDPAGTPFNGGTITEGLTIADPDGAEDQLTITGTGAGSAKLINATAVHTSFTLDSDGGLVYASDDFPQLLIDGGATSARLNINSTHPPSDVNIALSTNAGLTIGNNFTADVDGNINAVGTVTFELPTSDPGVPGQLYSVAGVVHISL